jgi:hypothetical protein
MARLCLGFKELRESCQIGLEAISGDEWKLEAANGAQEKKRGISTKLAAEQPIPVQITQPAAFYLHQLNFQQISFPSIRWLNTGLACAARSVFVIG